MLHFREYRYKGKTWRLDYEDNELIGTESYDINNCDLLGQTDYSGEGTFRSDDFGSPKQWEEMVKEIGESGELVKEGKY